jgi:small subunit ribosomal protein S20
MANLKASKKNIIRSKRNHDRNQHLKTTLKTAIKKSSVAISSKDDNAELVVRSTCRLLDKSVTKGIIKKNTAARKKSRLMTAFNLANA